MISKMWIKMYHKNISHPGVQEKTVYKEWDSRTLIK